MKFIVDAQLPPLLANLLVSKGLEVIHTDNLPQKQRTSDTSIRQLSISMNAIVVTKDSDFIDTHLLHQIPKKLLWVNTGNIKNRLLLDIFRKNLQQILEIFQLYDLVEITNDELIGHE